MQSLPDHKNFFSVPHKWQKPPVLYCCHAGKAPDWNGTHCRCPAMFAELQRKISFARKPKSSLVYRQKAASCRWSYCCYRNKPRTAKLFCCCRPARTPADLHFAAWQLPMPQRYTLCCSLLMQLLPHRKIHPTPVCKMFRAGDFLSVIG